MPSARTIPDPVRWRATSRRRPVSAGFAVAAELLEVLPVIPTGHDFDVTVRVDMDVVHIGIGHPDLRPRFLGVAFIAEAIGVKPRRTGPPRTSAHRMWAGYRVQVGCSVSKFEWDEFKVLGPVESAAEWFAQWVEEEDARFTRQVEGSAGSARRSARCGRAARGRSARNECAMSNNIRRDVEALADLGMGPDAIDRLAAMGMPAGAFADFRSLDTPTRQLVLRLLDDPSEADFRELDDHATGEALAKWLLTLPAYVNAGDEDDE